MRDKILLLLIGFASFTISYSISYLYFDILTKEEYIMEHLVEEDYGIDEEGEWIVISKKWSKQNKQKNTLMDYEYY